MTCGKRASVLVELKNKPGVVAHTCNPSAQEAGSGGLPQFEISLDHIVKPCLKTTPKND